MWHQCAIHNLISVLFSSVTTSSWPERIRVFGITIDRWTGWSTSSDMASIKLNFAIRCRILMNQKVILITVLFYVASHFALCNVVLIA